MTRKTKFTQEKMSKVAMYNGPYIDIFPLDYVPKDIVILKEYRCGLYAF